MLKIVFASHSAPGGIFRVGSHHLAEQLSIAGHEVAHISSTVSVLNLLNLNYEPTRIRLGRSLVGPAYNSSGVLDYVPFTLIPSRAIRPSGQDIVLRSAVPRFRKVLSNAGFGHIDVLMIDQPLLSSVANFVPTKMIVYRPTDIYTDARVVAAQDHMLESVDGVVATSRTVLDSLRSSLRTNIPSLIMANGVDTDHFEPGNSGRQHQGRRNGMVYVGALDNRLDWAFLRELAEVVPRTTIDLFGPRNGLLPSMPANIRILGIAPYRELPILLRRYRVGLMPFTAGVSNMGRSPMKLYEYLACGLNVLAANADTVAEANLPGVWSCGSANVEIVGAVLAAEENVAGVVLAKTNSWASRAKELRRFIDSIAVGQCRTI